jgi:hypothetical protein
MDCKWPHARLGPYERVYAKDGTGISDPLRLYRIHGVMTRAALWTK